MSKKDIDSTIIIPHRNDAVNTVKHDSKEYIDFGNVPDTIGYDFCEYGRPESMDECPNRKRDCLLCLLSQIRDEYHERKTISYIIIGKSHPKAKTTYRKSPKVHDTYPNCYGSFDGRNPQSFGCWICLFQSPCSKLRQWGD